MIDIIDNLTNNEWRVRISCCNALADLLRANVEFNLAECGPELWKKLFRVMDDIHEGTRLAATNTAKILSKVSYASLFLVYVYFIEKFVPLTILLYNN